MKTSIEPGASNAGTATGKTAPRRPDFRLLDLAGDPAQLSALGTPAIVKFWASWCEPRIEEMPDFERLHQATRDRVTLVGINRGESLATAQRFATQTGANYTLLLDLEDALGASRGPYRIVGMPTTSRGCKTSSCQ